MIILRNKLYAASTSQEKLAGAGTSSSSPENKWADGLSGFTIKPFPKASTDDSDNTLSIGELTQAGKQTTRVGNTLEKTMSDVSTPMGVNYVSSIQTKPKKKKSWIARMLRKGSKPAINTANQALEKVPIMSDESKAKQRRKLRAIDFYVDTASDGLDNVAERIYSEERMSVSATDMRKAETDGVVQRRPDGKWGIIAKKKRLWWSAGYDSRESAEAALRAYHAGRH